MTTIVLRNGWSVRRVTAQEPCGACGKGDWCCHVDGGGWLCQRVESDRRVGDAGWFHSGPSGGRPVVAAKRPANPPEYRRMAGFHRQYRSQLTWKRLDAMVRETGVDAHAYEAMELGFDDYTDSYTFPMRDADGRVWGIRRRRLDGGKFALSGSRSGLFIVEQDLDHLVLPEGPTDSAVAVELGFSTWGRPDAKSCSSIAISRLARMRAGGYTIGAVTVIGDDDTAGSEGANQFAERIAHACPLGVRVWAPPNGMDFREFVDATSASKAIVESFINATEVTYGNR